MLLDATDRKIVTFRGMPGLIVLTCQACLPFQAISAPPISLKFAENYGCLHAQTTLKAHGKLLVGSGDTQRKAVIRVNGQLVYFEVPRRDTTLRHYRTAKADIAFDNRMQKTSLSANRRLIAVDVGSEGIERPLKQRGDRLDFRASRSNQEKRAPFETRKVLSELLLSHQ